ncbi:MAG TPA: hypothetical protein VLJ10_02235, partial [Candidatus Bathyarchaeia archaeon]|nr:hypothetical protein [Candidatus Bathyarchaeia archaeon]
MDQLGAEQGNDQSLVGREFEPYRMDSSAVFQRAVQLYFQHFKLPMMLGVLCYLFIEALGDFCYSIGGLAPVAGFVVSSGFFCLFFMVTARFLFLKFLNKDVDLDEAFRFSLKRFWAFLSTYALYLLIVLGGVILLVVPAFYWGVLFSLAPVLLLFDENIRGPRQALERSHMLVKGYFWPVATAIVMTSLVSGVLFLITSFLFGSFPSLNLLLAAVAGVAAPLAIGLDVIFYHELAAYKDSPEYRSQEKPEGQPLTAKGFLTLVVLVALWIPIQIGFNHYGKAMIEKDQFQQ